MKGAFIRKLVLLMVLVLGATVAQADNGSFYLGVRRHEHQVVTSRCGLCHIRLCAAVGCANF